MRVIDHCGRIRVNNLQPNDEWMLKNPPGGSWRVNNNGQLQFYDPVTAAWYTLFVDGPAGAETLAIGPADASPSYPCGYMEMVPSGGSWRVHAGNLQFYNPTTALWYTLFVDGPSGAETLAIGPGET